MAGPPLFADDLPDPPVMRPLQRIAERPGRVGAAATWVAGSFLMGCAVRFIAINGRDRTLVLASQAFTAMIPLVIILAGFSSEGALGPSLVVRFHVSGDAATSVITLFARPPNATGALTVVGLVVLFYSVLALARYLQRMYEAAWQLPPLGVRGTWNSFLGLVVLLTQIGVITWLSGLLKSIPGHDALVFVLHLALASVLWLQIQYLLLSRRVPRRALVPGAVTAACGQAVVTIYSAIWMPHIIELNSERYGLIGVTFALLTWLIVVVAGIVAAAVVSAEWARRSLTRSGRGNDSDAVPG
jgi:membrane protein